MAQKKADPLKQKNPKCERKKRSSITIGGKVYDLHEIHWTDITGDSTIVSGDEFEKMSCAEIVSKAYIYKKDKNNLYTFASYQTNDIGFGDRNIIPLGVVKKVIKD